MTSHSDGKVRVFDYSIDENSLKEVKKYSYNWMPCTNAIQSPSNNFILGNFKDHYSYIWKSDLDDKIEYQLNGHNDIVYCGLFVNDSLVVTGSADQKIAFWKLD